MKQTPKFQWFKVSFQDCNIGKGFQENFNKNCSLGLGLIFQNLLAYIYLHLFCKLDHCLNVHIIFLCCEKI